MAAKKPARHPKVVRPRMTAKGRENLKDNLASLTARVHKRLIKAAWRMRDLTGFLSKNQYEKIYLALEQALDAGDFARALRICRRYGKTHVIAVFAMMQCWKRPGFKVIAAAPTKLQMRQILVPTFEAILATCPKELEYLRPRWNQALSRYEFDNGSYIVIGGCDNKSIERLLGQAANLVLVDEAGYVKDLRKAVKQVFDPMVSDTDGMVICASTPPADPTHYFHTFCAEQEARGWLIHLSVFDNDRWEPHRIERQKEKAGGEHTEEWQREWLAIPTLSADLTCFLEFHTLEKELVRDFTLPPYYTFLHRILALDYGYSPDGTGILLGFWDYPTATLYIQAEALITRMTSDVLSKKVKDLKEAIWGPELEVYRQVADVTTQQRADLAHLHDLDLDAPAKSHKDANVNNLNLLIRDKKIVIHPSCKNLIMQLKLCQWDKKKGSGRREFIRTEECLHFDLVDALLYLVRAIDRDVNPIPKDLNFDWRTMGGNRITPATQAPQAIKEAVVPSTNVQALAGLLALHR